jgi:hypothetical protein
MYSEQSVFDEWDGGSNQIPKPGSKGGILNECARSTAKLQAAE